MNATEIAQLQQRIHAGIPLSPAMGYRITGAVQRAGLNDEPPECMNSVR